MAATTKTFNGFSNTLYHYDAVFGRLSYTWEEKYLINITGRRDGNFSRFGSDPGKQFGNFGAIGAGWIFSREAFVQNGIPFLSFGKLRASYGTTGNDQLTDYQYLSTYTPYAPTYQGITGLYPTALNNPNFAWELVKKIEGGLELGFLKDRILIAANYYRNRTGNQLVGYPLPLLSGFSKIQANLPAVVQNSGTEFTLNTTNIKSRSFTWTSYFNFSIPRNKLISYPNLSNSAYAYTYVIGKPLSTTYRFSFAGINDTTGHFNYLSTKGPTDLPSYPHGFEGLQRLLRKNGMEVFENSFFYKGFFS